MNLLNISQEFTTDEQCLEFLEKQKWPNGVVRCPTCGNDKISRITRKTPSKNKRAQLYQCLEKTCKQQFSATSGTIFHDSHLPILKWFMAVSLVMDAKKGMSAKQIQQHLGIGSYQTAWHMVHRIREAMEDQNPKPMSGIVEMDETYIGGKAKRRGRRARSNKPMSEKFDMVVAMRERSKKGKADGRVRYFHVPDTKKQTIGELVAKNIDPWVDRVYTDQSTVYDFALNTDLKTKHRAVNHSIQWIIPGSRIHTNTVESSFSLLKRGLIGSFHRVSTKHLQRYLNEFEYRFNERNSTDKFSGAVSRMCSTKPLTYKNLTSDSEDVPF